MYFIEMNARAGVDAESGLVHSSVCTAHEYGERDVGRSVAAQQGNLSVRRGQLHPHGPAHINSTREQSLTAHAHRKNEYSKGQMRAKVEHPFRAVKHQFIYTKARFHGPMKNIANRPRIYPVEPMDDVKAVVACRTGTPGMCETREEKVSFKEK